MRTITFGELKKRSLQRADAAKDNGEPARHFSVDEVNFIVNESIAELYDLM